MKNILMIVQKVDKNDDHRGFLIDWISEFAKKFDTISVVTVAEGQYALPSNVHVYSLGKERGISKFIQGVNFYRYLLRLLPKSDVIFAHASPIFAIASWPVAFILSKKIILWYAHKSVTPKLRLAEFLSDDIVTSTSEGFRIKSEKVHIIGQGINIEHFKPSSDNPPKNTIISVGRITPVKNYRIIIETIKILHEQGHDFYLSIIGLPTLISDVVYEKELKELVKSLDLESQIKFLGKINYKDLPHYYQSNYFYLNISKTGSLDKTILEAMACGCIPLSSNDSARKILPPELVLSDEDPKLIARQILEVQSNLPVDSMVEYVKNNHSLTGLVERVSSVIDGVRLNSRILIAGYAYIRENYFRTFDSFSIENQPIFILPKRWPIKKGKMVYYPPRRDNVYSATTLFHHSDYPIVGGLFKGWMPFIPFILLKLREFDVFYNCNEPTLLSTLYNTLWAKLFGMKVILFSWENISFDKKFKGFSGCIHRLILRANLACASGLICGNTKGRDIFKSLTKKPLMVIPLSGLDTEFFKPNLNIEHKNITYLFAGSVSYRKGIDTMLEAFKKVLIELSEARLKIVGSGEYENMMLERIKDLDIGQSIDVLPWADHNKLLELFQSADVFLYPSISYNGWEEQFGYSIAEASLCGLPVIATRSGSIPELVQDGKTGVLVEEKNVNELAEAMFHISRDSDLRHTMGINGRQYIADNYSYSVVANKLSNFFNSI